MKKLLLACSALLLVSCVTVEQDVKVDCEVQPVDPAWDPVVAPFYFRDRVEVFQQSLLLSSSDIEVVDSAEFWKTLFTNRDPDADVNMSEFRHSDVAIAAAALGIRHLVVLDTLPDTQVDDGVWAFIYNTREEVTTQGAVMVTFTGASCDMERYLARAEGRDHAGWLYLGYHFDADTPTEALRAVTDRMSEIMLERAPERPVKVVILAAKP
jgi:hypothetical protein